jgi:hypothetical protein
MTRIIASPHLEMAPIRLLSPDWFWRGVRPNAAPTLFEFLKRAGISTMVRNVKATTQDRHQSTADLICSHESQELCVQHVELLA